MLFNKDLKIYRVLLNAQMKYANWTAPSFWTPHLGFIGTNKNYPEQVPYGKNTTKSLKPTGKPIEVYTDFMHKGGDAMDVPLKNRLTDKMLFDTQLQGHEEDRKLTYMHAHIWNARAGVIIQDSKMGVQLLQKPETQRDLMKGAAEELTDKFSRWTGYQPYPTILEGYSENLTSPKSDRGGAGLTRKSHPNFYVVGQGKAVWSETPATYEANVATALNTIGNTDVFSTDVIEKACLLAAQHLIIPTIMLNGKLFYGIVISEAAAYQLRQDTKWIDAQKAAYTGLGEKSPLISGGVEGTYGSAAIFVDSNIPAARITGDSGYDATRGTVNYGNANPLLNPRDTSTKKLAILFGASCVGAGLASPLHFEEEYWDYKNKKTEGGDMIVGFERADIIDEDGKYGIKGSFKENTSSLVIAHYGADSVSW